MKNYIILAAAAVIAMTSCAKMESDFAVTPDAKVTFQTANYVPQTKAGEVSVFNDFKNFRSRAFLHAEGVDLNDDYSLKTNSYQEFFGSTGETISPYNSSNAIISAPTASSTDVAYWAPSHEYYWPKSSHSFINFVGWYGTDGTDAVDPTITYAYASSKWTATMTWTWSGTTAGAAGANLLYADMAWRYNDNPDASYKLNGLASSYKGVPMLFHHALAQINVKAYAAAASGYPALSEGTGKVSDTNAEWVIKLTDVKITPIYSTGTLVLTNADPGTTTTQAWSGDWAGTGSTGDLTAGDFTVQKVTSNTAEDVYAATCVLPQTIGADVVLSFNLDITTTYKTAPTNSNHEIIPYSIKLNDFSTSAWEQNHKYTYYLIINPAQKTVRFDPAVDAAWVEISPAPEYTI